MFILYAVVVGLLVGFLAGGRVAGLASLHLRWPAAVVGGLLVQVALFSPAVASRVGDLGPPVYVASTMLVGAAVLRNWSVPGMPVVAAGAACNLLAIVANGGYMPASAGAIALMGGPAHGGAAGYSNSAALADPALWFLTDVFAMPRWVPFANVFSVGDVLIGTGIALVIVLAMRSAATAVPVPAPAPAPDAVRPGTGSNDIPT